VGIKKTKNITSKLDPLLQKVNHVRSDTGNEKRVEILDGKRPGSNPGLLPTYL
jgi:hypothetical protein